ncbi:MAG TPA: hypothetical protein VK453_29250 [Micromonosporaceae bacterium]|nr:hypothetical protein [Micromonosporaceae bacterium]
MEQATAVLIGGPEDQTPVALSEDTVIHEVRLDDLVHRYVRTTAHRDVDGQSLLVFNYDGQTYDGAVHPPVRD